MTEDIDYLIESMNRIRNKLQSQLYTEDKETQTATNSYQSSLFVRLSDSLLLKIFLFLTFTEDLPNVLETCKYFNIILKSRKFQVLSYKISTKSLLNQSLPAVSSTEDSKTQEIENSFQTKGEVMQAIKKMMAVSDFLTKKTTNQSKNIEDLNKEIIKYEGELRIQKSINNKFIDKISKVEKSYEDLHSDLELINDQINKIEFSNKTSFEDLSSQSILLLNQKTELEKHNKILNQELNNLKTQNVGFRYNFEIFENAVMKMKEYFETMFEAKMRTLIESFEQ